MAEDWYDDETLAVQLATQMSFEESCFTLNESEVDAPQAGSTEADNLPQDDGREVVVPEDSFVQKEAEANDATGGGGGYHTMLASSLTDCSKTSPIFVAGWRMYKVMTS